MNSISNLRDLDGIPTKDGKVTQWGRVYPSYLQAAYNQMIINHGDIDAFYEKELGIGVEEKASLREHLLTTGESEVLN